MPDWRGHFLFGFMVKSLGHLRILAEGGHNVRQPVDFILNRLDIQVADYVIQLLAVKFDFLRTAPPDGNDFVDIPVGNQVMGNVQHDITNADYRDFFADDQLMLAKGRQFVVMVNHLFGVVHTGQILTGQTKPFGSLRSCCHQNRAETHTLQLRQ